MVLLHRYYANLIFFISILGYPVYKSDNDPDVFVHTWCQIDPYFPCTDVKIQVLGEPSAEDSQAHFSDFLAHALCNWECANRKTHQSNVEHIDLESTYSTHFAESVNLAISEFAEGEFGFLAIPARIVFDSQTRLTGLLPVSTKNNNTRTEAEIKSGEYFLLHDFSITATSNVFEDEQLRGYLRYIYAENVGRQIGCAINDIDCLANYYEEGSLRSLWDRPTQ